MIKILPYIGVDNIRFGMTPEEVGKLLGDEKLIEMPLCWREVRMEEGLLLDFSKHDRRLVSVEIMNPSGRMVDINGLFPFESLDDWHKLIRSDPQRYRSRSSIILYSLGVSFSLDPNDADTVCASAPEQWDGCIGSFQRFDDVDTRAK